MLSTKDDIMTYEEYLAGYHGLNVPLTREKWQQRHAKLYLSVPTADEEKWDLRFLNLAQHISIWSKDPSTKCGAVIVRPNRTIASLGYNGFPRGIDDSPAIYADREAKYARVVHAEMNAILSCTERPQGFTLYTFSQGWGPCCDRCAAHIIQAGITRVVFDKTEPPARAWSSLITACALLDEANIEVKGYSL